MMDSVKTLCPYCGVGCGLEVSPNGMTYKVKGDKTHRSSLGNVCVKGGTVAESLDSDRLLYPMKRESLDQSFERISWDEAIELIVAKIKGAREICMYGSGQLQTEDYYVAQKLLKGYLGTNNFDSNSRLCMSSAVAGYIQSFGSDGPPCCYEDLDLTDCAFLIGTNTAECHPIIFNRLRKHHKQNKYVKLIVVDPRCTPTAEVADLHLAIEPGTDIDLLNGIGYLLLKWEYVNADFIEECTDNFNEYVKVIEDYTPELVTRRCGITIEQLETAAKYWGESHRVLSLWSMGVNQSSEGTAKITSLINLHLMTGNIGKPGCGPFSLTGQPNAMGGRESGGLANLLPGYRLVKNPEDRSQVERFWKIPEGSINDQPGRDAHSIILGLEAREIDLLWIVATNPAVSMPDLVRTKQALLMSEFTIYQDAYYPTETANYAHLLLPGAQWGEKTGTMTNSEKRVTLAQAIRSPLGEAKADWQIFVEVARGLGFGDAFGFKSSAEVFAEYVGLTKGRPCDQSGMSHELLAKSALSWPLPEGMSIDPDRSSRLYTDYRFYTSSGRAQFVPYHSKGLAEPCDPLYPFILTVGRLYGHWHTQTRTGRIPKIRKMHPHPFVEIHPHDAQKLGITDGVLVKIMSRRGMGIFPAKVTRAIVSGTLFVPMHWGFLWADQAEANSLTHWEACPFSHQPELKACAVNISVT